MNNTEWIYTHVQPSRQLYSCTSADNKCKNIHRMNNTFMSTFKHGLHLKCAIHHHLSLHKKSCLCHLYHKSFCLWPVLLHLVKIYVQLLLYITITEKHCMAVCDDQMRQKSPAAMQTCLSSIWNKHFVIIQLCQHHMTLYELKELESTVGWILGRWHRFLRYH